VTGGRLRALTTSLHPPVGSSRPEARSAPWVPCGPFPVAIVTDSGIARLRENP